MENKAFEVYLGLGSNLGDRSIHLRYAVENFKNHPEIQGLKMSAFYETNPIGGPPQGKYLNAVIRFRTCLTPEEIRDLSCLIERERGRVRTGDKNGPRTLDIDLLFYQNRIIRSPDLTVPHPRISERLFVLKPLRDIAPGFIHPVYQKTIEELYRELCLRQNPDDEAVRYSDFSTQSHVI